MSSAVTFAARRDRAASPGRAGRGRPEPGRHAPDPDQPGRHQGHPSTRCGCNDRSTGEQHTVAKFNMYVNLPHNFKGTHMSRFVEILHHEREISVESLPQDARGDDRAASRPRPATSR